MLFQTAYLQILEDAGKVLFYLDGIFPRGSASGTKPNLALGNLYRMWERLWGWTVCVQFFLTTEIFSWKGQKLTIDISLKKTPWNVSFFKGNFHAFKLIKPLCFPYAVCKSAVSGSDSLHILMWKSCPSNCSTLFWLRCWGSRKQIWKVCDKAEESNLGFRQLDLYLCSIIYLSSKILTGYSHFF